jgi:hypothetical protein
MWLKFEQALYSLSFRVLFKPHLTYFDQTTDNKQMPKVIVNETLAIMFDIRNHLKINLIITDVTLLWKYESDDSTTIVTNELTNDQNNIVECSSLKELNLAAYETYKLRLHLVPKLSNGNLTVLGIKYRLGLASLLNNSSESSSLSSNSQETNFTTLFGKQLFELKGPRLNNNPANMRSVVYDIDQRLSFKILNQMPLLQIEMNKLPTKMYCDQFVKVKLYFINLNNNNKSIGNIKIASNGIAMSRIYFCETNKKTNKLLKLNELKAINKTEFNKFKETTTTDYKPVSSLAEIDLIHSLDDVKIESNQHYELDMWIRGPSQPGEHKFYFMFYYQEVGDNINTLNTIKYSIFFLFFLFLINN